MVPTLPDSPLPLSPSGNNKQLQMPSKVTQKFRSWSSILQIACQSGELKLLLPRSCSLSRTPLLSSLPGYHQLARLYYFTFFFLPFLALLLFEEAKCFITYSSSHSSRCAKVFINWAAETAAWGDGWRGSDRAGQAGIRLADSGWDGQLVEVHSTSSRSANC